MNDLNMILHQLYKYLIEIINDYTFQNDVITSFNDNKYTSGINLCFYDVQKNTQMCGPGPTICTDNILEAKHRIIRKASHHCVMNIWSAYTNFIGCKISCFHTIAKKHPDKYCIFYKNKKYNISEIKDLRDKLAHNINAYDTIDIHIISMMCECILCNAIGICKMIKDFSLEKFNSDFSIKEFTLPGKDLLQKLKNNEDMYGQLSIKFDSFSVLENA